ncbi:MAG: heme-copper oxidase subunit III [Chloroflexaceae bacterium]|nr:heme-copper oxidase subunit III [Chloroflexaceae bacterium]NJO04418.1 heme-copper oxidase subunit III [Chloroflexaceae bacterium]
MAVDQAMAPGQSHTAATATAQTVGVSNRKLGIWIFLASEVIFFSALIGGGILLRLQTPPDQWPVPGEVLNVPLTSLNTFILIVSSVTVVQALAALQDNIRWRFQLFLVCTFILGAIFLGIQVYEYNLLIGHGLTFTEYVPYTAHGAEHGAAEAVSSVYGTAFYIQTGFHGAHVFLGVMWLGFVMIKAFFGGYSPDDYEGVEIFGLYWHFVDLVWILLFTIVYLI